MESPFDRTERLLGAAALERLQGARVAVFGLGGVGGAATEALARAGVGNLDLIDADTVKLSNLNRQLFATMSTVGLQKTDAAALRIREIAPQCRVLLYPVFVTEENVSTFPIAEYDYVVDCVDTVSAKLALIGAATAAGVKIISSMGTGNKLDASAFRVSPLEKTSVCPLARVMRTECKKRGFHGVKVVYSEEVPKKTAGAPDEDSGKIPPASVSFVPPVAGYILAGEVIKDLTGIR